MSKAANWIVALCLFVAAGAYFITTNIDDIAPVGVQSETTVTKTKGTTTSPQVQFALDMQENTPVEGAKDDSRISQINNLVTTSIDQDKRNIDRLEKELSFAEQRLVTLKKEKVKRQDRLKKLSRIQRAIVSIQPEVNETPEQRQAQKKKPNFLKQAFKKFGAEYVAAANSAFDTNVATILGDEKNSILSVNGLALLIIDAKRPRVGAAEAKKMYPLLNWYSKNNTVKQVMIKATKAMSVEKVAALTEYLTRAYGWTPLFVQVPGKDIQFDLTIELMSDGVNKDSALYREFGPTTKSVDVVKN